MPSTLDLMSATFAPASASHFVATGPASVGDDLVLSRAMTSAELRRLAAHWRATRDADDAERADRVANALEWLADHREPRPMSRLRQLGERISGWMGL